MMDANVPAQPGAASEQGSDDRVNTASREGFSKAFRAVREARGVTLRTLANRVHMSASFLSMLQNGQRKPTKDQVLLISNALELSAADEARLLASAGMAASDIASAVEQVVEIILERTGADDLDTQLVREDLIAAAQGWQDAFAGMRYLREGKFPDATKHYGDLIQMRAFSAVLQAYLKYRYAYALARVGGLAAAIEEVREARNLIDHLQMSGARGLKAEIMATRGLLALREGNYEKAKDLLTKSRDQYATLLSGSQADEDLASQGFGRSYKRMAQLALFQGDIVDALTACATAEAYLGRTRESAPRSLWLRRIHELKAWALSKLGARFDSAADSARAIELHTRAQRESRDAGDNYGYVMGFLYLGDDYRRVIESAVQTVIASSSVDISNPTARRSVLVTALQSHLTELDKAEQAYLEARQRIKDVGDRLLLGRCLASLATIQRFRAGLVETQAEAQHIYSQAQQNLESALIVERDIGQGRRIPSIFETMANIALDQAAWYEITANAPLDQAAWDEQHGQLVLARKYLQEARTALNSPTITALDHAADTLRQRVEHSLTALTKYLAEQESAMTASVPLIGRSGEVLTWESVSVHLLETARAYITSHGVHHVTTSDTDEQWLARMLDVEQLEGSRILVQNELSVSLSPFLVSGSNAKNAQLHLDRYNAFVASVEAASRGNPYAPNHDLCCRPAVSMLLTQAAAYEATSAQIKTALRLIEKERAGYVLDSTEHVLPIAFMLKGQHVLIEVPSNHSEAFAGFSPNSVPPHAMLCYAVVDEELARQLRATFEQLVDLVRNTRVTETTEQWLRALTDMSVGSAKVGSPGL